MTSQVALREEAASQHDRRAELKEFLRSRRARLRPEDVGMPSYGRRRVPGLRREELAQLAGVSFAYYARLEQGFAEGMSTQVLDAVAHALRLTEAEHAHLIRLAQPERPGTPRAAAPRPRLRPAVQHLLDSLGVPAFVIGPGMDILGWNRLAATVFGDWGCLPPEERNTVRLIFLSPTARERFVDPARMARGLVGVLRIQPGLYPDNSRITALVAELSEKSEEFRRLWAKHEVGCAPPEVHRMRHPLVGEFDLTPERMLLTGDESQRLIAYYAKPGSPSGEALRTLAGLSADHAPLP